jgi:GT2 family glycosyltransferase
METWSDSSSGGPREAGGPVSVVIPAYNARATLGRCLEALARQTRRPREIVVVDNASSDGTGAVARAFRDRLPHLRVVEEPSCGEAHARNRGVAEARGEVIAFTDADCVPEPTWLERLLEPLGEAGLAAVTGEVTGDRPRSLAEKCVSVTAFPTGGRAEVVEGLRFPPVTFYTANFAVRRQVLLSLGPFDVTMKTGHDVDLCCRLLRGGYRIAYVPEALVAHVHRDSFRKVLRRLYQYGRGVPPLFRKHYAHGAWVTLPGGRAVRLPRAVAPCWINVGTPDRVLCALALAALRQPWLWVAAGAYLVRIALRLRAVARRRGVPLRWWEVGAVTAAHVVEFPVFTAGCVAEAVRQRLLCVV